MHAICIHEHGGPEALRYDEISTSEPGAGEARVRIEAAGLNYIDVYHRTGLYPSTNMPFTPGMEGAGVVEAIGSDVTEVNVGDRVGYAMHQGSYTEEAIVPSKVLVPLPDSIDTQSAAAAMLQGMTAHYLTRSTYPLSTGDTALVHAAAGGVGLLLIQMAKTLGTRVLGTVSTPEKAELAKGAGADEVILYTETDFEAEVKRLTDGRGVDVVYDSVAKTTFDRSLNCLRPRGYLALFGQSSGPVPPFDLSRLSSGSLFVTRPDLGHHAADREELMGRAGDLFEWISSGTLKLHIDRTFPLQDAADAHRALEGRQTTGKVLLIP